MIFSTLSEQKAYILCSILRNAGQEHARFNQRYSFGIPHGANCECRGCPDWLWEKSIAEMYARYELIPEDNRR